jgi:predicted dehydrogenase
MAGKKIILVGCGNIGSRHLQALTKLNGEYLIEIIEPNDEAVLLAKLRLGEMKYDENLKKIVWKKSISKNTKNSDLVIIATNSKNRVKIIDELLKLGHKIFLIEKIVCQSIKEFDELLLKMKKFSAKGWVNTNRRYYSGYQKIKEIFKDSKKIHLSVFAGNLGLGTNSIHYIDLFCWLARDNNIKINGEFLIKEIFENKRGNDFKEFQGTLVGTNQHGLVSLTFLPSEKKKILIHIYGDGKFVEINELENDAHIFNHGSKNKIEFKFEHTSVLTTKIIDDIFLKNDCLLPTLEESQKIHIELFRTFNQHIKKILNSETELCPIT